MTLADAGRHSVTIHGPRGLTHAIATMRLYAKRDTLAVTPREVGQFHLEGDASGENRLAGEQTPIFQDQHVAVYAVPLVPEGYTQDENAALHSRDSEERHSLPGSPSAQAQLKRKRSPTRGAPLDMSKNPWEMRGFQPSALRGADADTWTRATVEGMFNATALTRHEPVAPEGIAQASADPTAAQALRRPHGPAWIASPLPPPPIAPYSASLGAEQEIDGGQPLVLSYICAAHAQRGKFDPARARELGVPPGPDFAKLTRGEVVRVRRAKDPALRAMVLNQSKKGKGKDAAKAKGPKGKGKQTGGKPSENGNAEAAQQSEEPEPEIEMEESDVRPEDVLGATRAGPVSQSQARERRNMQ